jgi:hypothetical protein
MRSITLGGSFLRLAVCAVLTAPALASCGGHAATPMTAPDAFARSAPQSAATYVSSQAEGAQATIGGTGESFIVDASCTTKYPLICVKQGGSSRLGIEVTCHRGTTKIDCGTVHWSTKPSNAGLKASFKPNPGNPAYETVTATKTIKVGSYYQLISTTCSLVPNCPKDAKLPIDVEK